MPVQIFRRGMHDDVEASLDWALGPRSGKGVVGHRNDLSLARNFRNRLEVDQLQQRIARRFDPDHPRVWFDCALEIFRVGQIDVGKIEVRRASPHSIEQTECAAIKIVTRDDMRAAVEQLEHCRHRSEAGCKGEAARPAFQIGDAFFVGEPGWID